VGLVVRMNDDASIRTIAPHELKRAKEQGKDQIVKQDEEDEERGARVELGAAISTGPGGDYPVLESKAVIRHRRTLSTSQHIVHPA